MDGIHDLGGMQGFGPVVVEAGEPVFHERWEAVARALVYAAVGHLPNPSASAFRHTIERMDPAHYLASSYYEHWLTAAATMAVEAGLVTPAELEERAGGRFGLAGPVHPAAAVEADAAAERRAGGAGARFAVGDRVQVWDRHPVGHTRCPRYVRGHVGVVTRRDVDAAVPDIEAHSPARVREATYSVRFAAGELWHDGQDGAWVNVDLWDSYLEPA